MNSEQLTASLRQIISAAQSQAIANQNPQLADLHILSALLEDEAQTAARLLSRAGGNLRQLAQIRKMRYPNSFRFQATAQPNCG